MEKTMVKSRVTTKATKTRKFVDIPIEFDKKTLDRLNKLADLAAVTLSQVVSVILSMYVLDMKEIKGEGFKRPSKEKQKSNISLGDK